MNALPVIDGTIDRRFLINYRVDPDILQRQLPSGFRVHLVDGFGVAGICVLRLSELRPKGLPRTFGVATENAAHRVAVEWEGPEGTCRGVYIARRDTSSSLTVGLGGRLFPGVHHRADFEFRERARRYELDFESRHDGTVVAMTATTAEALPEDSVFSSLEDASSFFQRSPLGFSPRRRGHALEGLELDCATWRVEPLRVERVASSYFDDPEIFSKGSVRFDSALVMRDIKSTWRARAA